METNRDCLTCKGTGVFVMAAHEAWTYTDSRSGAQTHYPATARSERPCSSCQGRKTFAAPDVKAILAAITAKKGGKKTFRRSAPKHWGAGVDPRAYYVWRLARFHGGADVTMPMTADMLCRGDSFKPELDRLADAVAKRVYGTDMAAAYRWGRLLVNANLSAPKGLPASAYENGPVVTDGEKPWWEGLELS